MSFRDFQSPRRASVDSFYRDNHRFQTYDFARQKQADYAQLKLGPMGMWEACEKLDTLIDDSDPDTELSQLEHLLQTAEAARTDGQPDWFVATALVHDLGKILSLEGEPQWAVVGDTFPLGCPFDERIVYSEYFTENPDTGIDEFQQEMGVYQKAIGLDNVTMSWGHDEYMYMVARPYLPEEALFVIRYHSFYSAHQQGAYDFLMNDRDRELMEWVRTFSRYDLYSKGDKAPDVDTLAPYYRNLLGRFFPDKVSF